MIFVDTNYFIRFFLKDIPAQYEKARGLFDEGAKGNQKLFTSTIVIFEIYWLFSSFYEKTKSEVIDILRKTLSINFIEIREREIITKAIEIYENSSLDFEDCYNIVYSEDYEAKEFNTFNRKLTNFLKKNR